MNIQITDIKQKQVGPMTVSGIPNCYGYELYIQTNRTGDRWIPIESCLIADEQTKEKCQGRCAKDAKALTGFDGAFLDLITIFNRLDNGWWFRVRDAIMKYNGVELPPMQPLPVTMTYIPPDVELLSKKYPQIAQQRGLMGFWPLRHKKWTDKFNDWFVRNPIAVELGFYPLESNPLPQWLQSLS